MKAQHKIFAAALALSAALVLVKAETQTAHADAPEGLREVCATPTGPWLLPAQGVPADFQPTASQQAQLDQLNNDLRDFKAAQDKEYEAVNQILGTLRPPECKAVLESFTQARQTQYDAIGARVAAERKTLFGETGR